MAAINYIGPDLKVHQAEISPNRPKLAPVASTGSYNDLYDKPVLQNVRVAIENETLILTL